MCFVVLLPQERMARIAKATQGFLYLVSVTGVTGVKANMSLRVEGLVVSESTYLSFFKCHETVIDCYLVSTQH